MPVRSRSQINPRLLHCSGDHACPGWVVLESFCPGVGLASGADRLGMAALGLGHRGRCILIRRRRGRLLSSSLGVARPAGTSEISREGVVISRSPSRPMLIFRGVKLPTGATVRPFSGIAGPPVSQSTEPSSQMSCLGTPCAISKVLALLMSPVYAGILVPRGTAGPSDASSVIRALVCAAGRHGGGSAGSVQALIRLLCRSWRVLFSEDVAAAKS